MKNGSEAAQDASGLFRRTSAGVLAVLSFLGIAITGLGTLLALLRVIWYPGAHPWSVVGINVLAFAVAIWAFKRSMTALKSPEWARILVVAMGAAAFAALLALARQIGGA